MVSSIVPAAAGNAPPIPRMRATSASRIWSSLRHRWCCCASCWYTVKDESRPMCCTRMHRKKVFGHGTERGRDVQRGGVVGVRANALSCHAVQVAPAQVGVARVEPVLHVVGGGAEAGVLVKVEAVIGEQVGCVNLGGVWRSRRREWLAQLQKRGAEVDHETVRRGRDGKLRRLLAMGIERVYQPLRLGVWEVLLSADSVECARGGDETEEGVFGVGVLEQLGADGLERHLDHLQRQPE
mmetsp:Transcript_30212/g.96381  ORF Transcript_30212/g.96381 Transcript_30212/m.96381 type:complete len:239 (-) Transcript_30212:865-1581(-)